MSRAPRKSAPLAWLAVVLAAGCGRPTAAERYTRPQDVTDFRALFAGHCAACHGADGNHGPAPPLNDPVFLAVVPDAVLTHGIPAGRQGHTSGQQRTRLPAGGAGHGGGLTDKQVAALVAGIRKEWPTAPSRRQEPPPPYLAPPAAHGAAKAGQKVYARACSMCHGDNGEGMDAGALNDPAFLPLVSDQLLRRIAITGRPDFGMPDYADPKERGSDFKPLTGRDVTDLVAFLKTWRKPASGGR
jgi:mono/diheme cytochrome c family protein